MFSFLIGTGSIQYIVPRTLKKHFCIYFMGRSQLERCLIEAIFFARYESLA